MALNSNSTPRARHAVIGFLALLLLAGSAATSNAQVLIKVNDTVNFKLGILMQPQADWLQDAATDGYTQNLFIRRCRLLFAGQVAKNVTFFVETDAPNLGKQSATGKNIQPSMFLQDAFVSYKVRDELIVDAGLILVSVSRNGLQGATTLLPIDYSAYTFSNSAPTQSSAGRDTGVQARGYLAKGHFEYRVGMYQGVRDAKSRNAFRTNVRVMYNFLDPESGFFYTGTYLGKKKVFAIGGGYEQQNDYNSYAADLFLDHPLGTGSITAQADVVRFDGGTFLTTLPKQTDQLVEVGYLIPSVNLSPFVQYVHRDRANTNTGDETRYSLGLALWHAGHNANLKAAVGKIDPKGGKSLSEYTLQFQLFYF